MRIGARTIIIGMYARVTTGGLLELTKHVGVESAGGELYPYWKGGVVLCILLVEHSQEQVDAVVILQGPTPRTPVPLWRDRV